LTTGATVALGLGAGAVFAFAAIRLAIQVAPGLALLDIPNGWKIHSSPTPYVGWALVLAVIAAVAVAGVSEDPEGSPILAVAVVLAAVGVADDLRPRSPLLRLAIEAAAGVVLFLSVDEWRPTSVDAVDLSIAVLIVIVSVNAFNLLDLMDGVAAATASVSAAACAVLALAAADRFPAVLGATLCAACAAFLIPNLSRPSRAFLGDGGSMPIGFLVAALILTSTAPESGEDALLAIPLLLGVPLYDLVYRIMHRLRRGISLLSAGRDSLATLLEIRWGSARAVTAALAATQALLGAIAVVGLSLGTMATAAGVAIVTGMLVLLARRIRISAWTEILADAESRSRARRAE
jgi:UDP-GlcNAc:undecaprenyl-phosphate/decaprenyl-phosphate GlcNAc-1-phosphate transferase